MKSKMILNCLNNKNMNYVLIRIILNNSILQVLSKKKNVDAKKMCGRKLNVFIFSRNLK